MVAKVITKRKIPEAWHPLRYHPQQHRLWRTQARFAAVVAGRGSGKTELARRRIVRYLAVRKPWSNPLYFFALPTFKQAKRVAWKEIKRLVPKQWVVKANDSELLIETVFGSSLYVVGMDQPERIEGVQWDGCVIDESSDQKPKVFDLSVLPALSHRNAWCWRIGVPKRYGRGAKEFKAFYDLGRQGKPIPGTPDRIESYTWPSADILTPEQVSFARATLDELDYREQYEASFEDAGGLIFHAFDEAVNVKKTTYQPHLPIVVGSDFNVNPMCWVLGHIIEGKLVTIFDEMFIRNTNTQQTLDRLHRKYPNHIAGWHFYGDAAGQSRHTSASFSDYAQIRNDERFKNKKLFYPKANPRKVNRFAACNAMLRNAHGDARVFISPTCKRLIEDLKDRAYKEGTREPDDHGDIGHITDAFGYIIHKRFPIRAKIRRTSARASIEA